MVNPRYKPFTDEIMEKEILMSQQMRGSPSGEFRCRACKKQMPDSMKSGRPENHKGAMCSYCAGGD